MKILMMTPSVDENRDIEGFIPTWVRKLSEKVDKLYVITSFYNKMTLLPENVIVYEIHSLGGKWKGTSGVIKGIRFLSRQIYLNSIMLRVIPKVDVVFCHMHPIFTLQTAPYARLFRKPIVTWYTHGHVSRRLRRAHFLSNKMVTASEESLRIKSNKIIITGHGIDTDRFKTATNMQRERGKITVLSVGRISPIKNYETLIKAADILINEKGMNDLEFVIVGGVPMVSQEEYYEGLKGLVKELNVEKYVKFVGAVPYSDILRYYQNCDIHVNMCPTGGIDKAVLEAMACEKPVIVCNETFRETLKPFDNLCLFKHSDYKDFAEKLKVILDNEHIWSKVGMRNREEVIDNHSTSHLADSLVNIFRGVVRCT